MARSAVAPKLALHNVVGQFVRRCGSSRKMRRQPFADFLNPFDERVAEFLVLKMFPHSIDNALPELLAAFFVNRFIANNSELARARRYENQHRIAFARFVHAEPVKFPLRNNQWIGIQFAALNINANLAGGS
jgi:hypothetical protein